MLVETKNNDIEMEISPSNIPVVGGVNDFTNQKTQKYLEKQHKTYKELPKEGKNLIKIITISFTTLILLMIFSFILYFMHDKYKDNNNAILNTQKSINEKVTDISKEQKRLGDSVYSVSMRVYNIQGTLKEMNKKLK